MTELLQRLFGEDVAAALRAPYALGDPREVMTLLSEAEIASPQIATHEGTARFASIEAWMHTDVKGWTLAGVIDESQFDHLLAEARQTLRTFLAEDDSVSFRAPAHIVTASKAELGQARRMASGSQSNIRFSR